MLSVACIDCGKDRQFRGPSQVRARCKACATRHRWAAGSFDMMLAARNPVSTTHCADCGQPKAFRSRAERCRACATARKHRDGVYPLQRNTRAKIACTVCQNTFEVQHYRADVAIVCSRRCADELKRRVTGSAHPLFVPKQRMACEACGTVREVKPSLVSRFRFCSRNCQGAWTASHMPRSSSVEDAVAVVLDRLGVVYQRQVRIGRFVADFVIGRTVVEVDGTYWHSLPHMADRDARKDVAMRAAGYEIVRLPEVDVKAGAFDALLALV